jgi:guanosine-3',5'-bis(diphosphate) 3'-pyrophosphohydrolase
VNAAQVRERFGPVVASIVEDSLWLSKLPDRTGLLDDDGSRFLREYMVAVSRDHRAVVVMLADRLHSLRRASAAPLYEQHLRALEALQVYSPLAHALGVGKWLWELEDLSFRALFPDSYSDVERWQLELWEESEEMMEMAKSEVLASLNDNALLVEHVQRYTISSRRKSIFSTFKKMYQKNKNLEGIKDVFAMRIVIGLHASARDNADLQARVCLEAYVALRKALPEYTEGRGRFKDYVTKPKPNGYQSVHTTLKTPTGLPIEIQIRTEEMHAAAEFGDAAHNLYKGIWAPHVGGGHALEGC